MLEFRTRSTNHPPAVPAVLEAAFPDKGQLLFTIVARTEIDRQTFFTVIVQAPTRRTKVLDVSVDLLCSQRRFATMIAKATGIRPATISQRAHDAFVNELGTDFPRRGGFS